MSGSGTVHPAKRRWFQSRLFTHSLAAIAAILAAYFYLFYFHDYLSAPSVPASERCSPGVVSYLATNKRGDKIRSVESHCSPQWSDFGLYLERADGAISPPFLVVSARERIIRAAWASPEKISVDITGNDISVRYALDRMHGVRVDYTMHEIPAPRSAH